MLTNTRHRYGLIAILLHWVGALTIGYMWLSGKNFGGLGGSHHATHIAIGSGLAFLLLARVLWGALSTHPEPLNSSRALNLVASAVKGLLLLDILAVVTTGFLSVWLRGNAVNVFGLYSIASPLVADERWVRLAGGIHELGANLFFPLVGLHVLGALKHMVFDRDGTFSRMVWPRGESA